MVSGIGEPATAGVRHPAGPRWLIAFGIRGRFGARVREPSAWSRRSRQWGEELGQRDFHRCSFIRLVLFVVLHPPNARAGAKGISLPCAVPCVWHVNEFGIESRPMERASPERGCVQRNNRSTSEMSDGQDKFQRVRPCGSTAARAPHHRRAPRFGIRLPHRQPRAGRFSSLCRGPDPRQRPSSWPERCRR